MLNLNTKPMNTNTQHKKLRIVLLLFIGLLLGLKSNAQNQSDFWLSFEKCTEASAFQSHYLPIASGTTRLHTVMNHGVSMPTMNGVTFSSNNTFEVLDKSAINASHKTNFFLIHDAKVTASDAKFEVLYHYNYNGSYDSFVEATITLSKTNGNWTISEIVAK